jgi:tetratricopeptide (TPR) repeat protein
MLLSLRSKMLLQSGHFAMTYIGFTLLISLFLFQPVQSVAQTSPLPASVQAVIVRGQNDILDYHFKSAVARFDSVIRQQPSRPEGYFFKAATAFWQYVLSEREAEYDQFTAMADIVVDKAEQHFDANKGNAVEQAWAKYFLAETSFELAVAQGRAKNFIKAALSLNRGRSLYKEALRLNPQLYDAYKGMGLFDFFTSLVPGSFKWITQTLGYEGDRDKGLKDLSIAASSSVYSKDDAKFYAAMIQMLFYKNFERAEKEFQPLLAQHPQSPLLNYGLGLVFLQQKKIDSAQTHFQVAAAEMQINPDNALSWYAAIRIADIFYRQNNYAAAQKNYLLYQQYSSLEVYTAQVNYRLGVCSEILGNRDEAVHYYKLATSDNESSDEAYAKRQARERLMRPMTDVQKKILIGRNFFDAGRYAESLAALEPLLKEQLSADDAGELHYRLGRTYHEMKRYADATREYQAAYQTKPDRERMFQPYARFNLAKLYVETGQPDLAEIEFEKAGRYTAYDYERGLKRDVELELEKISKAKTANGK